MYSVLVAFCLVLTSCQADRDDKKWVWDDNSRNLPRNGYGPDPTYDRDISPGRYDVYENERPPSPGPYPNRPYLNNNPDYQEPRPFPGPIVPQRPGGLYTDNNLGSYGQGGQQQRPPGILTGPIPSWVKEGPFKEFDKCKCAAKFNCNSPGISYGHCDVGKQYCCYSTSKKGQIGGPEPSEPVHSIENGILAGPGGPVDGFPEGVGYQRPDNRPPYDRPIPGLRPGTGGGFGASGAGFIRPGGFGLRGGKQRPIEHNGNTYSPENGILVGPGGPFDTPNREYANRYSGRLSVNGRRN